MKKNGFTLIELLASISIIAILATIIVPMSLNLIDKSNKEQCEKMVDTILSQAELCYLDKFDLCYGTNGEGNNDISLHDLYINGYIEEEYKSQSTDITIKYVQNGNNSYNRYTVNIERNSETGEVTYTFNNKDTFCGL